jgi:DNA-binding beta-propeller fold protein YncE
MLGCASTPSTPEKQAEEYTWPSPPDKPRIKWIRHWSNEYDLKKRDKLLTFLLGSESVEGLMRPNGVVTDSAGNVYVADSMRRAVLVFDTGKNIIRLLGRGTLVTPISVAIDNKRGILYVSDSNLDKVFGFDKESGKVRLLLGMREVYKNPSGMVFDEERDRLFVSDTQNQIVRVFDGNGEPLFNIGKKGQKDGEFNFPTYLALDRKGRLYVVDLFNSRVQIFDHEGTFLKKIGKLGDASGHFSRPAGIGVDSEGHIYVVDSAFNNFQIFDEEGRLLLWVGKAGKDPGEFLLPSGMYIDKNDTIYITDTYNRRVQVFQYLRETK